MDASIVIRLEKILDKRREDMGIPKKIKKSKKITSTIKNISPNAEKFFHRWHKRLENKQ